MKTLYLECRMGAAGDMLTAALSELVDQQEFLRLINSVGLEGVVVTAEESVKCGIYGTHMNVSVNGEEEESEDVHDHHHHDDHDHAHHHHHDHEHHHECEDHVHDHAEAHEHHHEHHHHDHADDHDHHHEHHHHDHDGHEHHHEHGHHHHHHHSAPADVYAIIDGLNVSDKVKEDAKAVYGLIAEAEAHAHHMEISEIHFHEVGTKDAIADVVGVCLLMEMIRPDRILASPVATGSGMVRCAHGILPVPAPATAYLLQGIPSYAGRMEGELLTPTGAALLKHFVTSFENMPVMKTEKIGYGMGKKDFPAANCVRAFLGESGSGGEVVELVCNLDDQTPEEIGFAMELLMKEGALDVYVTDVHMKKNRPGVVFTCMCRAADKEKMLKLMFAHTTTLGIREYTCRRYALEKSMETVSTPYGDVRVKTSSGYGVTKSKPEHDDLRRIAEEQGISIREAKEKCFGC